MDGIQLDTQIREAEDRVRRLLDESCRDDSYSCQAELREAVERLRHLRAHRYGYATDEGATLH